MKTPIYLLFLIVSLLSIFVSCNKTEMPDPGPQPKTELPPATMTGANTFGFVLNDTTNWVAQFFPNEWTINGTTSRWAEYYHSSGLVRIGAKRRYFSDEAIDAYLDERFYIEGFYLDGTFEIDNFGTNDAVYLNHKAEKPGCGTYLLDTLYNNQVDITHLDTINRVISGTFSFEANVKGADCITEKVSLKNGRFDIKY